MAPVVAVQNRYNLLDRAGEDVLRACELHGVAFVPYFPLAAGLLRTDLDPAQIPPGMGPTASQSGTLDAIAARHAATRAQIALVWLLATSPSTLLIPGTSSTAHLAENTAAASMALTADEVTELNALR